MAYHLLEFEDIEAHRWDEVVKNSPDGWLYQTARGLSWAESKGGGFSRSFGVATASGELVAIVPLFLIQENRRFRLGFFNFATRNINSIIRRASGKSPFSIKTLVHDLDSFSGPAIAAGVGAKGRKKIMAFIVECIDTIAKETGASSYQVRLSEASPGNCPDLRPTTNPFWELGVSRPFRHPPRLVSYVSLTLPEEKIIYQFDEGCRSAIRKAIRAGVGFDTDDRKNFSRYFNIHRPSWNRTMGHHQPEWRFKLMFDELDMEDNVHAFFVQHGGVDAAAVLLHTYKDTAYYYGGASVESAQNLGVNNFALFNAMLWARANGARWFVVGIFDSHSFGSNAKEYSVGQYKAQFSKSYYPALEARKIY